MRTSSKTDEAPPVDYLERVNRALDFIVKNLAGPLKLEAVARAAHFSPFHFHRIFKTLMGENLTPFIKRQRLERALYLMSHRPGLSLTDVALDCGFGSSSEFSRSFKQRFGVPPSGFDMKRFRNERRQEFSQAMASQEGAPKLERLAPGLNPDGFEVTLRSLPRRSVAYLRVLDPYQPNRVQDACAKMLGWAEERGWENGQWLGYMWEDPEIVAMQDCRYDVGLEVAHWKPEGELGCMEFPSMRVAEIQIAGDIELEQRAIDWIFGTWLPNSGLVPDAQPCFEAWDGQPFAHGVEHFELRLQLPVCSPT